MPSPAVQTDSTWHALARMLDEGDCIVKQGYLKKIKTMKKKYFVLYRDSRTGPARLEYYDTEKKFREKKSGQAARRAIMLRSCLGISDMSDTRQKLGIALYTKDDCFGVGFGDAAERDEWLAAMHTLVGGRRGGDPRAPMFEHVWDVNVRPKDLGKSFTGQYRLCLNVRNISLVKKASVEPDVTFPLEVVRRCGHSDNFFFIEVGRHSGTGEGELWMEAEDALIAQNMHYAILLAMNSNKEYDDLPPRIVPQQCIGSSIAALGSGSSIPQRSNSHSTDSRHAFMQSRVGGSAAGYDVAARGAGIRPQRSYTFSEPKRSTPVATVAPRVGGLGAFGIGGAKPASHRPNSTAVPGGSNGGSYLGQDLLDRNGSSFYSRGRSDSISSRATSSSLSIDECDQGLASRSLTPDLHLAAGMYLQPCAAAGDTALGGAAAAADRRSPHFGGSTASVHSSVHSSRGHQGPAFECPRNNTSSSASSLSGGSVDDPYLDMTPGNGGNSASPSPLRPNGAPPAALAYVTMVPCVTANRIGGSSTAAGSDAYAPMTPPTVASKTQEGYVEMCPATSSGGLSRCNSGSSGTSAAASLRPARPDTVRSYVRECGSDEAVDRALSRRSSVASQLAASGSVAPSSASSSNPYVEMSCSGGGSSSSGSKSQPLPYATPTATASATASASQLPGSGSSTPRSIHSASDAVVSSPRGTLTLPTQWQDRPSNSGAGSVASLHDAHSNQQQQSPRVATPSSSADLSKLGAASIGSGSILQQLQQLQQQQVDLFMEMDFDRPRTASDTFCNRPRTHSFSASAAAHRPRSSSHGQSSRHRAAAASRAGALGQLVASAPPSVGAASSAGSSRDSSVLGSSGYLDMTTSSAASFATGPTPGIAAAAAAAAAAATCSSAGYMDMSFDDRKPQSKSRHHHHQAQQLRSYHQGRSSAAASGLLSHQLTVSVPPPISSYYPVGRGGSSAASSQESLQAAAAGCGHGSAPLSPGDYVGIDFSRGFEQRASDCTVSACGDSTAAISPILLRSSLGLCEQVGRPGGSGGWDLAEPFPELSGSSSGEDVNSCRTPKRQQQPSSPPHPSPASSAVHSRSGSSCSVSKSMQPLSSAKRSSSAAAGTESQQQQQDRTGVLRAVSPPNPIVGSAQPGSHRMATSAGATAAFADAAAARLQCSVVDSASTTTLGSSGLATVTIAATTLGSSGLATVTIAAAASSDGYEEMGPCVGGDSSESSFGLTTSSVAVPLPAAASCDDAWLTSCVAAAAADNGEQCVGPKKDVSCVWQTSCDACECIIPKKGVSYVRQTSRDTCECIPRRAVCYIRPEPQSTADALSSSPSGSSSDDEDCVSALEESRERQCLQHAAATAAAASVVDSSGAAKPLQSDTAAATSSAPQLTSEPASLGDRCPSAEGDRSSPSRCNTLSSAAAAAGTASSRTALSDACTAATCISELCQASERS